MARRYDLSHVSTVVVDDNPFMLQIMSAVLHSMGIRTVHTFERADEAAQELPILRPDVIFTDWFMSPMGGRQFIRRIRAQDGAMKFVPVVVLTGRADRMLVGQARDAGADYTLSKPVSLGNVLKAFIHMIEGDRPFVQVGEYFGPDRRRKARPFEFADRRGGGRGQAPAARAAPG